jgi:hypothetical protein
MAIKLHHSHSLSLDLFARIVRLTNAKDEIILMERQVLADLNWLVHPPTPHMFLQAYLAVNNTTTAAAVEPFQYMELAEYLTEIALCHAHFQTYRSSSIALAALANCGLVCALSPHDITTDNNASVEIHECRCRMLGLLMDTSVVVDLYRIYRTQSPVSVLVAPQESEKGPCDDDDDACGELRKE